MIHYRKEIDGLRAVAVVSVILYHAKLELFGRPLFGGGFFGVDVFFVISGYLISKILFVELHENGRIDLAAFYARRARRILPALIAVSIATLCIGWFFLLPADYVDLSSSVLATFLFISNFFFYFETTEYGADDALLEPFLHTWSLAVEEQFYLVFPVLLLVLFMWQRKLLFTWLIGLLIASFVSAIYFTRTDPDLSFFLPFTRGWELLAGSIVAYSEKLNVSRKLRFQAKWYDAFAALGAGMIILPLFLVHSIAQHPGFITVSSVIGTSLILAFGSERGILGRLMSSRPAIAIGLISYSLYLWHFPVFSFGRMLSGQQDLVDKLVWVAITVVFSILSYRYVERPFRNRDLIPRRVFARCLSFGLALVLSFSVMTVYFGGFAFRVPQALRPYAGEVGYRTLENDGKRCHNHPKDVCTFDIDPSKPVSVMIVGDSHADSLSSDLYTKLLSRDIGKFIQITTSGCPIILGFSIKGRKTCTFERVQERLKTVEYMGGRERLIVIYFARTPVYLSGVRYDGGPGRIEEGPPFKHVISGSREQNLIRTLDRISQVSELIIVYPMPELGVHAQRYFLDRIRPVFPGKLERVMENEPLKVSEQVFRERAAKSFEVLDQITIPEGQRIYPHEFVCKYELEGWCYAHDSEQLFYTDSNHPNWILADQINNRIVDQIDKMISVGSVTN
ncbi:acyltransferase family protein [Ruegeria sp. ANG-S4]|uniref:acyltransferase family protein n=1 Tax=Ruegeria sp. ANG-S4 TaxID=1577904 RepID=UPI00068FF553|nr:acyltransferase family protein [Ruegeria sp. ANG-S4]